MPRGAATGGCRRQAFVVFTEFGKSLMLEDGLVVITGGAGHLGLACAQRFRERRLLITDGNATRLGEAATTLAHDGVDVTSLVADITVPEGACEIARTAARLGQWSVLIHAAGVAPPTAPETIVAVNLFGTINILEAFQASLVPGATGVCLASLAAYRSLASEFDEATTNPRGDPHDFVAHMAKRFPAVSSGRLAYSVSKRGTIQQVRKRASLWAQRGARLVSVSPGIIADTAMGRKRASQVQQADDLPRDVRLGVSSEIAAAVWLATSADAVLINGIDILVDGGYLAAVDTAYSASQRSDWHNLRV
jgi:NAD(P)-dependent dehydrogenase (short-subunit alcohol dehydrogenase family)